MACDISVLFDAIRLGNVDLIYCLLQGPVITQVNDYYNGRTPLLAAVDTGDLETVSIIVKSNCNINKGSDKHYQPAPSSTPLHRAIELRHYEISKLIVLHGADLDIRSNDLTPLELARERQFTQYINFAETLSARMADDIVVFEDLRAACLNRDFSTFDRILRSRDSAAEMVVTASPLVDSEPLLYTACTPSRPCERIVARLITMGAPAQSHPVTGYTPLHAAVREGSYDVVCSLLEKYPYLAKVACADVKLSMLPIHVAAAHGHRDIAELLLSYPYPDTIMAIYTATIGVGGGQRRELQFEAAFDPNALDSSGRSALYYGVLENYLSVVDALLSYRV